MFLVVGGISKRRELVLWCRHLLVLFCFVLFSSQFSFGQEKNSGRWPYGGEPDESRKEQWMKKPPLNFHDSTNFELVNLDAIVNFNKAIFFQYANFNEAIFRRVDFSNANFKGIANFHSANFKESASFRKAIFSQKAIFVLAVNSLKVNFDEAIFTSTADFSGSPFKQASFRKTTFSQQAIFTPVIFHKNSHVIFEGNAFFNEAIFDSTVHFIKTIFKKDANFKKTIFSQTAIFDSTTFSGQANFDNSTFIQSPKFTETIFSHDANFTGATFSEKAEFEQCWFGKTIGLAHTSFEKSVDFRRAKFDSVETIFVDHHTNFPDGDLYLYWDQFKGKENLRVRLKDAPCDSVEHYQRIETFYQRLRDNFLAQGNKASADDVMYELGWQRQEIVGGFWWTLYGWFFGWGFKPWRFLAFLVLPIIIGFSILWGTRYIEAFEKVIFKDVLTDANKLTKQEKSWLQRSTQSLFFSASVLLGFRFKKNWIIKHHHFLFWVWVEWSIGIGLYVAFALLVKGSRFDVIKGLLGF